MSGVGDMPTGGKWSGTAEDHSIRNVSMLGGFEFDSRTFATVYSDGTVWIQSERRLTAAELATVAKAAADPHRHF